MKINENKNALKGQKIIAQPNALGFLASDEIVRAMTFFKGLSFFSDENV
jgi:hypothetical protein